VIYDKDPLSNYAKVLKVLIDGQVYFDRDQAASEAVAQEAERQRLIAKEKKAAEPVKPDPAKLKPEGTPQP